jgi:hypothetical protein
MKEPTGPQFQDLSGNLSGLTTHAHALLKHDQASSRSAPVLSHGSGLIMTKIVVPQAAHAILSMAEILLNVIFSVAPSLVS